MFTGEDRRYIKMRFDRLEEMLRGFRREVGKKENRIMATVEELEAAVSELTVSVDAAVAAIGAAHSSGIDPAELDQAVADIKEQAKKLNDAVHAAAM